MTYATRWSRCWTLLMASGVGLSFLVWHPLSVLTLFLTATVFTAAVLALSASPPGPHSPLAALRWTRVGTRAVLVGGTVVAVGVLGTVMPYLLLPLVLLALVSSPYAVDRLRRRGRGVGPPAAPEPSAGPATQPPAGLVEKPSAEATWVPAAGCRLDIDAQTARTLSAGELCVEWRRSFVTLQSATSAAQRIRVVSQRQVYLDEMERRCPTGLRAWLESGARAAGGPDRFLVDGRPAPGRADPAA